MQKWMQKFKLVTFSYRLHAHHFLINISLVVPITVTYDIIIYHALSYLSTSSHIFNYPLLSYTSLRYWGKGWTAGTEVCSTWLYGILTYCWDKRNRTDTNKFWLEQSISLQPKITCNYCSLPKHLQVKLTPTAVSRAGAAYSFPPFLFTW